MARKLATCLFLTVWPCRPLCYQDNHSWRVPPQHELACCALSMRSNKLFDWSLLHHPIIMLNPAQEIQCFMEVSFQAAPFAYFIAARRDSISEYCKCASRLRGKTFYHRQLQPQRRLQGHSAHRQHHRCPSVPGCQSPESSSGRSLLIRCRR